MDRNGIHCTEHLKDQFWVIAVYNNPCRFDRRLTLFKNFIENMKKYNAQVCIVEVAYGDRNFETENIDAGVKVLLRTNTVLWHKENLINIGISRLPQDWQYVAWIDADIDFMRNDWIDETIHQLQFYDIVQMFEDAVDLGPNYEIMNTFKSFMYCHRKNIPHAYSHKKRTHCDPYISRETNERGGIYFHSGYAWAATRTAIDTVGGLLDIGIVGAGDHHMACSLIGEGSRSVPNGISDDYRQHVLNWETRALRLHFNVGYVKGTIYHHFHGKKSNRKYVERWSVLKENDFQPSRDLYKDSNGLLTFHISNNHLREHIRQYFEERNEDSIDM